MKMLLGERWVDEGRKMLEVIDPQDGSVVDTVPQATPKDLDVAIQSAIDGFRQAKRMSVYERATIIRNAANYVEERSDEYATLIAREGSKTIREARKEVSRAVNTLNVSADQSKHVLGQTIPFDSFVGGENRKGFFERVPIGVILGITPFNDPLNLVVHKVGPAIASGNAIIVKPATATPLSAIRLAEAFVEGGLPPGILQVITGEARDMGDKLISDDRIRMISFTGGVDTGKHIAQAAGLKKLSMELGSNSPVIVWEDADLPWAVESCVDGSFWAAGQNCLGVQRIYVHRKLYGEFRDRFVAKTKEYRFGPKLDESTDMGPVIDAKAADRIISWVREAKTQGAKVLTGGEREGNLVYPTVLENVHHDSKVHKDEVFGPTVNLYPVDDLDDAIGQANSLPFGIHAGIFTRDLNVAWKAVNELECAGVMVNDSTDYRLDAMPFGGVKDSGIGREGVKYAISEMTEPKVACWRLPEP